MKGERTVARKRAGERKNRDTIQGKEALYQTYVDMGLDQSDAARDCMRHIQRQRAYLKNRTGDAD